MRKNEGLLKPVNNQYGKKLKVSHIDSFLVLRY